MIEFLAFYVYNLFSQSFSFVFVDTFKNIIIGSQRKVA